MALNFIVNYSTSSTGPWTSAGTVASTTDVITGLQANTSYFVQIITVDTVSGLQASPVVSGPFTTASAESPSGTAILVTAGVQSASLLASATPGVAGSQNTILVTSGGQISVNGSVLTATSNVKELYYINHTCYQFNGIDWFGAVTATNGGTLGIVPDPRPLITGIALSNNSAPSGAVNGTVVGAISVASNNFTFAGTLVVGGQDNVSFRVSGANLVCANTLTNGTYSITLTATQTGTVSGVTVPTFTSTILLISIGIVAPAQAAAAGFNTMVFNDEFLVNSISPFDAGSPPLDPSLAFPKWYAVDAAGRSESGSTSANLYIRNGVLNMDHAPNNNGSQSQIGGGRYQDTTAPVMSTPGNHVFVQTGHGISYFYGYFEASIAFPFDSTDSGGFPAWWTAQVSLGSGTVPRPSNEIDFLEYGFPGGAAGTVWEHRAAGLGDLDTGVGFNNTFTPQAGVYHTYGCLWQGPLTNGGSGTIDFYVDNVHVGTTVHTGAGTNFSQCVLPQTPGLFGCSLILGSSPNQLQTVDWVRVWQ